MRNYFTILLLFTILILFVTVNMDNTYAQQDRLVFTPKDTPFNTTYANWTGNWWNWHLGIKDIKDNATLSHPRDNYSPEKCAWNQNGPVWYLPDGSDRDDTTDPEIRTCTIPEGKAVLVQLVGSGCSTVEGFTTEQEMLDCAIWALPQAEIYAEVNDNVVIDTNSNPKDKDIFYVEPFRTNLTYVENNIYGFTPGTYPGMVAGYWLFIKPDALKIGHNEISFRESAIEFVQGFPSSKRITNVQYNLDVVPNK